MTERCLTESGEGKGVTQTVESRFGKVMGGLGKAREKMMRKSELTGEVL